MVACTRHRARHTDTSTRLLFSDVSNASNVSERTRDSCRTLDPWGCVRHWTCRGATSPHGQSGTPPPSSSWTGRSCYAAHPRGEVPTEVPTKRKEGRKYKPILVLKGPRRKRKLAFRLRCEGVKSRCEYLYFSAYIFRHTEYYIAWPPYTPERGPS